MGNFFKFIFDCICDIFGEIEIGFLRGIGFILAIIFAYFILFSVIGINFIQG